MEPFYREVPSVMEAKRLLDTLAAYDLFQLEHRIKPDYANAGGLEMLEDGEWVEWQDLNGDGIDDLVIDHALERLVNPERV